MSDRPLVVLMGNPNTGKSTLFNALTGARARVGHYPGITVDRVVRSLRGADVDVLDGPGAYSLVARSSEEQLAVEVVLGHHGNERPDLVVAVVDATNLERNLYLVLQLLELEVPLVVALTMVDQAERDGVRVDASALSSELGVPVVPTVARTGRGIDSLREMVLTTLEWPSPGTGWLWAPADALAEDIEATTPLLGDLVSPDAPEEARRAMSLWALMSIDPADELTHIPGGLRLRALERQKAARDAGRDIDGEAVVGRYAWIDSAAPGFVERSAGAERGGGLDAVLLHPVAGFGVFLGLMLVVFQALFAWSEPAIKLIEGAVGAAGAGTRAALPAGIVADFVADGLVGGVGNVLVFIPQILLLFIFIGILEDSGYLARAAFLMDRIMNRLGLHGRAFVPLLSSFACAVPAVMATRTIERRRDRMLTMMVLPLMTCSARLPVYTLLIAALIPSTVVLGFINVQSLVMVAMYFFGVGMALAAAFVLGRTVLKGPRVPLLLELPPLRRPSTRSVGRLAMSRVKVFVREAGTVILLCTVVLWGLLNFPRTGAEVDALASQRAAVAAQAKPDAKALAALDIKLDTARKQNSYAADIGHAMEPALAPLGFDWKIGVGLLGAFAAREVFVSTLGIVYGVGREVDENSATLRAQLRAERHPDGRVVYTPLMGLALLVFFAIACQCMSTLAAVKRETRGYRAPAFMFAYMTVLAWISALAVYQGGRILGFG